MAEWEVDTSQQFEPAGRGKAMTRGAAAQQMITDVPTEVGEEYLGTAEGMVGAAGNIAQRTMKRAETGEGLIQQMKDLIRDVPDLIHIVGGAAYLGSGYGLGPAAVGAGKSLIGHGAEATMGPENVDYEGVKRGMDIGMMGMGAAGAARALYKGAKGTLGGGRTMPERPDLTDPTGFGVTQPRGSIADESLLGKQAKAHVKQFGEQTQEQLRSARERIAGGFDPFGQVRARSLGEAAPAVQSGIFDANNTARRNLESAAKRAGQLPAELSPKAAFGLARNISLGVSQGTNAAIVHPNISPQTVKAMTFLQEGMQQGIKPSPDGRAGGVNLSTISAIRDGLLDFKHKATLDQAKFPLDVDAMDRTIEEFDHQINKLVHLTQNVAGQQKSLAFTGDEQALRAWNLRRNRSTDYASKFKNQGEGSVGQAIENIMGDNPHDPKVVQRIIDSVFAGPETRHTLAITKAIKEHVGAPSETWSKVKQGTFFDLASPTGTDFKPLKIKERIDDYLKTERAKVVYDSPQERTILKQFADLHGTLEIAKNSRDPNVSKVAGSALRGAGVLVGGGLGGVVGHLTGIPYAATGGAAMGAAMGTRAADKAVKAMKQRQLNDIQRALPLVRQQLAKWQQAFVKAQRSETSRSRHEFYLATTTLVASLRKFGIYNVAPQGMQAGGKEDKLSVARAMGGPAM